jgi:hypothetical protein
MPRSSSVVHTDPDILGGTMDRSIERQHNLTNLAFGVVVINASSNRMAALPPDVSELLRAIDAVRPGEIRHLVTSPKRRRGTGRAGIRQA